MYSPMKLKSGFETMTIFIVVYFLCGVHNSRGSFFSGLKGVRVSIKSGYRDKQNLNRVI